MALASKDAALRAGPGGRTDDGDLELNMTPMIDIVFQLIVFFMLQLKFKEIDRQIDSTLPKTEGIDTIAVTPPDSEKLKLKVFRRGLDGPPETQLTVIRVDSSHELHLPTGWSSYAEESVERRNVFDAVLAQLGVAVRGRAAASPDRSKLLAEIVAPPPSGGYVPHGDVMRILDVQLAYPGILLALVLIVTLGPSQRSVIIALAVGYAPYFARIIRGAVLRESAFDYVTAARALGQRDSMILLRHIGPNVAGLMVVHGSFAVAGAMVSEASLSFLGLGVSPSTPSWGRMLSNGTQVIYIAPHIAVVPIVVLSVVIAGWYLLGEGFREWLDPRRR